MATSLTYKGNSLTSLGDGDTRTLKTSGKYLEADIIVSENLNLQNKIIMPTTQNQPISADSSYEGLDTVTVQGDTNLVASNIKHGVNIFNTTGTFQTKIASVTTTPSSRTQTITFTGLNARPLAFFCAQEAQISFSKSYRWIVDVTYDGTHIRNTTHAVSGSSMSSYIYTTCTWSYSNGELTITSPSTGANGYFQQMLHRLTYIYEE